VFGGFVLLVFITSISDLSLLSMVVTLLLALAFFIVWYWYARKADKIAAQSKANQTPIA
jgi:flagellar biogenesis protein FliO